MLLSWGDYIYLHFMDRELRGSLGLAGKITDATAKKWVKIALLMSDMPLYVSLSHMYESIEEFPETIEFLFKIEKIGLVYMVTNHSNADEFLESRHNMYSFDKDRYENYFNNNLLIWPSNIYHDKSGTTSYLRNQIISDRQLIISERINEKIQDSLIKNKQDAITIQRFLPIIKDNAKDDFQKIKTNIQIRISRLYTKRYLEIFKGTIITGLNGFVEYDDLAKKAIFTNYRIYDLLTEVIWREFQDDDEVYLNFISTAQGIWLKNICHHICEMAFLLFREGETVDIILTAIRQRINIERSSVCSAGYGYLFRLYNELNIICRERGLDTKMDGNVFLIVVATPLELDILVSELRKKYPIDSSIGNISYFYTKIGENTIFIVKSQMGTNGPGGATLTVDDAVLKFKPDAVIMCGIAWGGDSDRQCIGDVLVATKIWDYDPHKINEENEISRGNVTPASANLIQALEMISTVKKEINLHFGLIASGSHLLNNKAEVARLKEHQPELIGGEMEASGMVASCERRQTNWIMIKGICDWGFAKDSENKEKDQKLAAHNAVSILIELLKKYN